MFEFFIALFGGAYYGNKLLGEHVSIKDANRNIADARTRKDQWVAMVTDRTLEEELRLFIACPENQDAVLERVSEVYDKILDGRHIDELYPRWMWCKKKEDWSYVFHEEVQEIVCKLDSTNALRIMMAKQGKFPSLDAITGSARQFSPNTKLEAQVLIWCANELKRHGVKEEFYVPNVLIGFGAGGEHMGWIV